MLCGSERDLQTTFGKTLLSGILRRRLTFKYILVKSSRASALPPAVVGMSASRTDNTYLGFDWSTQTLKAIIVGDDLQILHEAKVEYDNDLPEFRTHGGVLRGDRFEITAPPLMWVKALDLVLDRLTIEGADFSKVTALSGGAQQHGSVWWAKGCSDLLGSLDSERFLHEQFALAFTLLESPIWMDTSTRKWCQKLEDAVGGPEELANITGSRAYERFTGPQIAKIFETKPRLYESTERISLVSSFACSLFAGKIVPIDWADASGMNLFNIRNKKWNMSCLEACADKTLIDKLGEPIPSQKCIGNVSSYFVQRFGFNPTCQVIAFTGDNPSTVAGMRLSRGWIAASLGTSDTLLLSLQEPHTVLDGHILCSSIDTSMYSALICFSNGSLVREATRNRLADKSWETFNEMLDSTPRGNFGNMGLFFDVPEIVPKGGGVGKWLWNRNGTILNKLPPEAEIRALIEGQFVARRAHSEDMGFVIDKDTKILATGGASKNKSILQVLSDVFNSPVYTQDCADAALLGSAYRAKHGFMEEKMPPEEKPTFDDVANIVSSPVLICTPYGDADQVYKPMLKQYRTFIAKVLQNNS